MKKFFFKTLAAMALPYFPRQVWLFIFNGLPAIFLIYFGVLAFNTLYIQSIGSEIGLYSLLAHLPKFKLFNIFDIQCFNDIIHSFVLFGFNLKNNRVFTFFESVYSNFKDKFTSSDPANSNFKSALQVDYNLKNHIINIFIYIILLYFIINTIYCISDLYGYYMNTEFMSRHIDIPTGQANDKVEMDPVRWWPSGVPQGMSIIGTAVATFAALSRMNGVSPRLRVLGALGSAGVAGTQIMYHSAIENSVGFNRLMWGLTEFRETGKWPGLEDVASRTNETTINKLIENALKEADKTKVDSVLNEINGKEFISTSDFSSIINHWIDIIFREILQILKPVEVNGYFDDLLGQRMFIEIILFIMCISIVLLFIFFIINIIFILNIDKIKNRFDNKIIRLYINYQAFFSRISLIYAPIFILFSLITLSHGLHWLITHQIPYNSLGTDLHQYISTTSPNTYSNISLTSLFFSSY